MLHAEAPPHYDNFFVLDQFPRNEELTPLSHNKKLQLHYLAFQLLITCLSSSISPFLTVSS